MYSNISNSCELDCSVNSNRTECLTCPDCVYGYCVRGVCQCWAGYMLDSNNTCTTETASPNDNSTIGINLSGISDWSTQWALVDLGKQARTWIIQHIEKLDDLYIWSVNENIPLRKDRYPASVPYQRQLVIYFVLFKLVNKLLYIFLNKLR